MVWPDRRVAALIIWLTILDTTLALAAPWPLQFVVDYGLGKKPFPPWLAPLQGIRPVWLAGIAAGCGLLLLATGALAGYLVTFFSSVLGERMTLRLRAGVFGHVLRTAPHAVTRYPLGELTSRIGPDVRQVTDTVGTAFETLLPDLWLLAGMTTIAALLDWRLTLVVLSVLPLYALTTRLRNRSLRGAQKHARACSGELAALAASQLARIPAIHVFDQATEETSRHTKAAARSARAAVAALDASSRFRPVTETLPGFCLAAVLVAGTIEVTAGRLTIGGLLVFLAYLSSLTGPIHSLAMLSTTIARGEASRDRVFELLRIPALESPEDLAAGRRHRPRPTRSGCGVAVRLEQVSYGHRPGQLVLDQTSTDLRPGEIVALTGPSGAGKSTLLALLLRLADPQSGRILIDGKDISALPLRQLRRLVTLVPQDPWLHPGTIADNIRYGQLTATPSQIKAAADHAGVTEFAGRLPDNFQTLVGEHGQNLSGGQRRRVAIARALLRDTPLLLLDEPTAGLDPAAESFVITSLLAAAHGKTIILVTHSPLVSKLADRTVHLENGQLIRTLATGQPRQLIATQNDQVAAANEAARRRSITVLPALSARGFLGAGRAAPHDVMPDPPETLIPVPVTLPSHAGSRLV
jgi:ABC-type multidrug transport system fused ATPase/permease subunit